MKERPQCEVDEYGVKRWCLNGELHREDGPAIEYPNLRDTLKKAEIPEINILVKSTAVTATTRKLRARWNIGCEQDFDGWHSRLTGHYYLHGKQVHPETLVDLQLSRGTFCYYDEETEELRFEE